MSRFRSLIENTLNEKKSQEQKIADYIDKLKAQGMHPEAIHQAVYEKFGILMQEGWKDVAKTAGIAGVIGAGAAGGHYASKGIEAGSKTLANWLYPDEEIVQQTEQPIKINTAAEPQKVSIGDTLRPGRPNINWETPPSARSPRPEPSLSTADMITVRQGDTLFGIARQHNMSVDELKRMNNLRGNTIMPGQKLAVSGEGKEQLQRLNTAAMAPNAITTSRIIPGARGQIQGRTFQDAGGNTWDLDNMYKFVFEFENFRSRAYPDGCLVSQRQFIRNPTTGRLECPKGKERYSIGMGTLASGPNEGPISREEAQRRKEQYVARNVVPHIRNVSFGSQNEFNSVVSWLYNNGPSNFANVVNNDGTINFARMANYTGFRGKENPGLVRRRNTEFFNAIAGAMGEE